MMTTRAVEGISATSCPPDFRSIDRRRHDPDHHRWLLAWILPPERLFREAEAVPFAEPVPDPVDLDVEASGHHVAGSLRRAERRLVKRGARREDRTQHLEATAKIGRQKLLHQPGFACAKQPTAARAHHHAALCVSLRLMSEEQAE